MCVWLLSSKFEGAEFPITVLYSVFQISTQKMGSVFKKGSRGMFCVAVFETVPVLFPFRTCVYVFACVFTSRTCTDSLVLLVHQR